MRKLALAVAALLLMLCVPRITSAQTPILNPTAVIFDHSDFASTSRYDGGYFALLVKADNTCDWTAMPAALPAAVDNLGKPTTTTGVAMSAALVAKPIGCYVYKVRALDASGLYSDWSPPSGPFWKKPATPGQPVVK